MSGQLQDLTLLGGSVTAGDLQHLPSSLTSLSIMLSHKEDPWACNAQLERLTALQDLDFAIDNIEPEVTK